MIGACCRPSLIRHVAVSFRNCASSRTASKRPHNRTGKHTVETPFSITRFASTTPPAEKDHPLSDEATTQKSTGLVYESPLGSVVGKLRSVSLLTAIIGSTGVPAMIAFKGGIPPNGILAVAMTFVAGTMGSTAAIHFIFGPYVYKLERVLGGGEQGTGSDMNNSTEAITDEQLSPNCSESSISRPTLLKATTRSLFLQYQELVFDPELDVEPYKGLRPMCNFLAKKTPLYVHPEYVYDEGLLKAMKINKVEDVQTLPTKENPDDFL